MQKILFPSLLLIGVLFLFPSCSLFSNLRDGDNTNSATVSAKARKVINAAEDNLGAPYLYAGTGDGGYDCSGLVYTSFKSAGIKIPRSSVDQANVGTEIERNEVRPGDLVFFATKKGETKISHVGIVTKIKRRKEDVLFIHAANAGVQEDNLFSPYYLNTFVKATRPY
jgi:probable lipoprotein NlpC